MEAKDTVMPLMRIIDVAREQAEVSFKAGQESRAKEYLTQIKHLGQVHREITEKLIKEARQEGRKEVVEWVENNQKRVYESEIHIGNVVGLGGHLGKIWILFGLDELQAKLKEWEVKHD